MFVFTSVLEKGINVREELNIYEITNKQHTICFRANWRAQQVEETLPYTEEYVEKAGKARAESHFLLREFLDAVEGIKELELRLENYKVKAERFKGIDTYYAEQAALYEKFIASLFEQVHLAPIIEATLNNRSR